MEEEYGSMGDYFSSGNDNSDLTTSTTGISGSPDFSVLAPFKSTMQDAVSSTGTSAPSGLSSLSNFFHDLVVAPSGGVNTGSTVGNILNYFSKSLTTQPTTQQQQIVRTGVSGVVNGSSGMSASGLLSSPLVIVGILAVMGLVVFLVVKKA